MAEDTKDTAIARRDSAFARPAPIADAPVLPEQGVSATKLDLGLFQAVQAVGPRDLDRFEAGVKWEARKLGERAYYQWEQGGKKIVGGSIGLAMAMIRNYGKATCVPEIVGGDSLHTIFKATFVDFENGTIVARLFKQRIKAAIGGKFEKNADQAARAEDIVFQIGQSKALRNSILAAMPAWLVDEAVALAQDTELSAIEKMGVVKARDALLSVFAKHGIKADRIVAERGKPVEDFTVRDLVELKGSLNAIKDGQADARGLFPEGADVPSEQATATPATSPAAALFGDAPKPEPAPDPEPPAAPEGPKAHPFAWPADADTPQKRMAALSNEFGPGASNAIKEASDKAPMPWPKQNPAERMTTLEDARKILTGETA